MKNMKKVFALVLALVMVLALSATAIAAPAAGTITINPPENATGENTYQIYKVFDATVGANGAVAYKLLPNVTTVPEGFTAANGYVTGAPANLDIAATAIANYSAKVLVDTVTTTGTTAGTSKALDPGYYYISTSTGTAVIVQDGANVTVNDKNVIPPVVKSAGTEYNENALAAIRAVGTSQPFTAKITKTHGATKLVFTDTMTNMTYNGDLVITVGGNTVAASTTVNTDAENETFVVNGAEGASSFTVTFDDAYIAGLADNTDIILNYSAKITSDALSVDPATNTATLSSGNNNSSSSVPVEVYNALISVEKTDGNNAPLPGAKFKLKNSQNLYYAGNGVWNETGIEVEAVAVQVTVPATEEGGEPTTVTKYIAEFKGLGDGTYTLEESTVPEGYNKASDQTITVANNTQAANLVQSATVVNESGATLPTTGGIGTTIFYVLGAMLMAGAVVLLITKKRVGNVK